MYSSSFNSVTGPGISNGDAAGLLKRLGIEETQLRRSVAHDEPRTVVRDAPALTAVTKRLRLLERREIVDEADLGSPRELNQGTLPVGDAFAEVLRIERLHLHDLARFELHLANARPAVEARPFVHHPSR